jgi:FkbM family methyltransferase
LRALEQLNVYGVHPRRVLHIGAHNGEEAKDYRAMGVQTVVFVEAIPQIFERLTRTLESYPEYRGICAVCSDVTGAPIDFHVSSNDAGSSSFLGLGNHAKLYPRIHYVETLKLTSTTADDLAAAHCADVAFDTLVLDTQGAELHVLRGATSVLGQITSLVAEVSEEPLYEGGCAFEEVIAFVRPFGLRLRQVNLNRKLWGNALFLKR